jgi:hypothetical protein
MKPRCRFKCRFVQITDNLLLCPHAAWGEASSKLGAIEEGRRLLERAGGYEVVLARIVEAENAKREAAKEKREQKAKHLESTLRYR